MADKSTFTPDEWKRVLGSTMLTGMAVTMADQSSGLLASAAKRSPPGSVSHS